MEALQKLGAMAPSKKSASEIVALMTNSVLHGNSDPAESEIIVAWLEGICKEYRKNADVKELLKKKLEESFGKISIEGKGDISLVSTPSYDYGVSALYRKLEREEEEIKEKKKAIEAALKNASEVTPYVDGETGEVFTTPPVDGDKKTVRVTLSKGA